MRRGMWIGVLILMVLVAIAVGVGAYNVGLSEGLEQSGRAGDVVRVIGPGYGFFPFGFLFPLLFFFLIFFLIRGAFWRGRWGGPGRWAYGPKGGPGDVEEWHRRLHQRESERPGGEQASA